MAAAGKLIINDKASMDGWAMYGEAWIWVLGDDTIIGAPGLQLPPRYKKFGVKPPVHGLWVGVRIERLNMNINSVSGNNFGIGSLGCSASNCAAMTGSNTAINSYELGVNYWYSKRFRATFNYVLNDLDGNTAFNATAKSVNGGNSDEHEFLFRLAVAL